jgi:hypothetical protein
VAAIHDEIFSGKFSELRVDRNDRALHIRRTDNGRRNAASEIWKSLVIDSCRILEECPSG